MANEKRRSEISLKILEIGRSLMEEGGNLDDYTITQSGTMMILLSSVILSEEDTFLFSEVCSMFSAKKVLDNIEGIDESELIKKFLGEKQKKPRKNKGDDSK
jgi:hypothetical protein